MESIAGVLADLPPEFRGVKLLVTNAGFALAPQAVPIVDLAHGHTMIGTNITGLVNVTHAVLPILLAHGKGATIINIGSIAGDWP